MNLRTFLLRYDIKNVLCVYYEIVNGQRNLCRNDLKNVSLKLEGRSVSPNFCLPSSRFGLLSPSHPFGFYGFDFGQHGFEQVFNACFQRNGRRWAATA